MLMFKSVDTFLSFFSLNVTDIGEDFIMGEKAGEAGGGEAVDMKGGESDELPTEAEFCQTVRKGFQFIIGQIEGVPVK